MTHWCCRKPRGTLYWPESSGVSPRTSIEPPWSSASPFRWLRRGEKGVNRFASDLGSRWCPQFGQRPRRRGEITGEHRLDREEEEPDMRPPLSVTQRLPPLFYLNSRFFAILQKSYLLFLSSKGCETNFVMIHGMTSF